MNTEIEYTENFEKTIFKEDLKFVLNAIREVHSEEYGWKMGEVKQQELSDGRIKIIVPLTKYKERTRKIS